MMVFRGEASGVSGGEVFFQATGVKTIDAHGGQTDVKGDHAEEDKQTRNGANGGAGDDFGEGGRGGGMSHEDDNPTSQEHTVDADIVAAQAASDGLPPGHVEAGPFHVVGEAIGPVGHRRFGSGEEGAVEIDFDHAGARTPDVEEAVTSGFRGEEEGAKEADDGDEDVPFAVIVAEDKAEGGGAEDDSPMGGGVDATAPGGGLAEFAAVEVDEGVDEFGAGGVGEVETVFDIVRGRRVQHKTSRRKRS